MIVDIVTNDAPGGWLPEDCAKGFGGSEESLIGFAEALVRAGATVRVGHPRPPQAEVAAEHNGVGYYARQHFQPHAVRDVLIAYREPRLWQAEGLRPGSFNVHWSVDVEPPWHPAPFARVHAYVCLTQWARARQVWVPEHKAHVIPYGIDTALLDAHRREQEPGLALYCASPDRGMARLLEDWAAIRKAWEPKGGVRLRCAYGWRLYDAYTRLHPGAFAFKRRMEELLRQEGVEWLGELSRAEIAAEYWRAQWWVHPLNRPDSELFCLNALKARRAGALPVVLPHGALAETAPPYLHYERWAKGHEGPIEAAAAELPVQTWDEVVAGHWLSLFDQRRKEAA